MGSSRSVQVSRRLEPLLRRLDPYGGSELPFSLRFWDGSELPATASGGPAFTIEVRDASALSHIVRAPDQLGVARAWVSGALDVRGDLESAWRILRERLSGARAGGREWLALAAAALELHAPLRPRLPESEAHVRGRLHSLGRDNAAVRHHYDVPTDFYRLVLGPSLVYSCAYFESPDATLEEAQEAKLDLICRKLDLREGERLLDVGCGWGSLVIHAAREYGAAATGVTLSPSQAEEARRRIAEAGLERLCRVNVLDYRALEDGPYDKIASVGMYEHVGREQLPAYAAKLRSLLRPGGRLLNHGITRVKQVPRVGKFISRYVFPDGDLQPVGELVRVLEADGFEVRHIETLREHYALTLRHWVANLDANRAEAARLAGQERERVWRLYMTGSAQAFDDGDIGVYQTLAFAPGGAYSSSAISDAAFAAPSRGTWR
jgi:cyclopropane-fatty-acyl-phospholipid synthase